MINKKLLNILSSYIIEYNECFLMALLRLTCKYYSKKFSKEMLFKCRSRYIDSLNICEKRKGILNDIWYIAQCMHPYALKWTKTPCITYHNKVDFPQYITKINKDNVFKSDEKVYLLQDFFFKEKPKYFRFIDCSWILNETTKFEKVALDNDEYFYYRVSTCPIDISIIPYCHIHIECNVDVYALTGIPLDVNRKNHYILFYDNSKRGYNILYTSTGLLRLLYLY